jgi:hypothetical protein
MSDQEPRASRDQQAQVRRLLAQARHDEPVPADVAARLDRVLDQLADEGPRAIDPPPPSAAVVDLGARRRRRAVALLVAAAVVGVGGVGIGRLVSSTQGGADNESADSGYAESGGDESGASAEDAPTALRDPQDAAPPGAAPEPLPRLTREGFAGTVRMLRSAPGVPAPESQPLRSEMLSYSVDFVCPPLEAGPGRALAVLYEGSPAVLVYRPVRGETQTVDLLQCGSGDVLRSTVLTAS